MPAPFIFVDELIYSELAREPRAHRLVRRPRRSDERLQHPLPGAARPGVRARRRAAARVRRPRRRRTRSSMSLAAVPAWLIARRVAGRWLVAPRCACSPWRVPSMAYTATIVTENLFYPVALLFAWSLVLVLERPSRAGPWRSSRSLARRRARDALAGARLSSARSCSPRSLLALLRARRQLLRPFAPLLGGIVALGCARGRRAARARAVARRPARRLQRRRRGWLRRRRRCCASGSGTSRS